MILNLPQLPATTNLLWELQILTATMFQSAEVSSFSKLSRLLISIIGCFIH